MDLSQFDPRTIVLVAGIALVVALALAMRLSREADGLRAALADREAALRDAQAARDRAADAADRLAGQRDEARTALAERAQTVEAQRIEAGSLREQIARLEAGSEAADEKIAMLQALREEMTVKFRDLAAQALEVQGEALSRRHVEKLAATLTPLREHVGHFETALKTMHESSQKERIELRKEIASLGQQTAQVTAEAHALTRALKSDQQKQGAWGEMVLERILESSGLRAGEEYEVQANRQGEAGRLRPDVVVHIPGEKTLVIDSKVSLTAYAELVNAEDDAQAAAAGRRHLASLRSHIDRLGAKDYPGAEAFSVDYVILFVPIEGALSEALRLDGELTAHALERNVTIATPTTLMMALKTVANVWAVQRRNRNAEEIARRAGLLYDKVAGFVGNMESVGQRLDQAQDSYSRAIDQLSRGRGNVLSQIDQLKTLGARTGKSIDTDFDSPEVLPQADRDPGA